MDDIVFEKVWEDEVMFEINIKVQTEYLIANHNFYMNEEILNELCECLYKYLSDYKKENEVVIRYDELAAYPMMKMKLLPVDELGNVNIRLYFSFDEQGDYLCYCKSMVITNLGSLSIFAEKLKYIIYEDIGYKVYLNSFNA